MRVSHETRRDAATRFVITRTTITTSHPLHSGSAPTDVPSVRRSEIERGLDGVTPSRAPTPAPPQQRGRNGHGLPISAERRSGSESPSRTHRRLPKEAAGGRNGSQGELQSPFEEDPAQSPHARAHGDRLLEDQPDRHHHPHNAPHYGTRISSLQTLQLQQHVTPTTARIMVMMMIPNPDVRHPSIGRDLPKKKPPTDTLRFASPNRTF